MSQLAKTIYFADYPKGSAGRSGLTMSFPDSLENEFRSVAHLSSFAIREMIGYESFLQLEEDARRKETSTVAFARDLLLKQLRPTPTGESDTFARSLQATFRGGKGSPLHDWYPYLEGYSPDFVNSIIDRFSPDAQTILDPFCGSGTTAFISALRGRLGLYAEVNPVCRYIIDAKLLAIRLSERRREKCAELLERLANTIESELHKFAPDVALHQVFVPTFGKSLFFEKHIFEQVLRLRSLADKVAAQDEELGVFFTVAVLRSLVPGSLLIRRGDLRFRTEEELRKNPPQLLEDLRTSLRRIASDLHDAPFASGRAQLVCEDARELAEHLSHSVDAVITSPPYLNGTNYFRNTKIELWFLRKLSSKTGLRKLRDAAITSGINDVTQRKSQSSDEISLPGSLNRVLDALRRDSYDSRIPLMVRAYFGEMDKVVRNLRDTVKPNAIAAIDLGDSCYGSVWVPTDRILAEMMVGAGFEQVDRIVLRERQSRDGRQLSQTLQVFSRVNPRSTRSVTASKKSSARVALSSWNQFKETLPHQTGDMAKRNWGHSLHSLCSYQGKLKPSIAHSLVAALLPKSGGRVLDPFAGVGTIPFEAQLLGHTAFAFDISPAALPITRAKIESVSVARTVGLLKRLQRCLESADKANFDFESLSAIRFNGPLPTYFHPRTLAEIVAARSFFQDNPPIDGACALVFAAMLHILHGNRPYALSRRSHPITPFAPTGPDEYRPVMERLQAKVEKSLFAIISDGRRKGRAFFQDATKTWPADVSDLDAIITSPPFFDSTRFHTANWMRLWFAGWDVEEFQTQPASFVDDRQKKSFEVYRPIFEQCAERLKPGGLVLIHLGKSEKCDMADALKQIASDSLEQLDLFIESVAHCESHGIRDKGTVTHHQYLLLRRA